MIRWCQISQDMGRESMPIFWGHGGRDNVLLYAFIPSSLAQRLTLLFEISHSEAETSVAILREPPPLGLALSNIDFQTYPDVGHEIWWSGDAKEMKDLGDFLERVLPQGARVDEESIAGGRRSAPVRRNGVKRNSRS